VLHSTELLAEIVDRLTFRSLEETVTYHDPCDLGRTSGIYEAPRDIIRAIPGVTLVEMADHHDHSLCCGGGGDVEMADKELSAAVAERRVEQAAETGAKYLFSACQQCTRTIAEAARRKRIRIRTMDVIQLVARQMER
jgi:heterodisulfide reductase subunit D